VCSRDERVCEPRKREGSDEGCSDLICQRAKPQVAVKASATTGLFIQLCPSKHRACLSLCFTALTRIFGKDRLSCQLRLLVSADLLGSITIVVHLLASNHSDRCHVTELIDVFRVASSFHYIVELITL